MTKVAIDFQTQILSHVQAFVDNHSDRDALLSGGDLEVETEANIEGESFPLKIFSHFEAASRQNRLEQDFHSLMVLDSHNFTLYCYPLKNGSVNWDSYTAYQGVSVVPTSVQFRKVNHPS